MAWGPVALVGSNAIEFMTSDKRARPIAANSSEPPTFLTNIGGLSC